MDVQRTAVLLLVLLRQAPCAEAFLSVTDPFVCYILDGVLCLYSILITALFFHAKLSTPNSKLENNSTYSELMTSGEQYDWLNRDIESGSRTRAHRPNDEVYTPLKPGAGDTYREIPAKNERRRNKNEMVYQVRKDYPPFPQSLWSLVEQPPTDIRSEFSHQGHPLRLSPDVPNGPKTLSSAWLLTLEQCFPAQSSGNPGQSTFLLPPSSQPIRNTQYLVQECWEMKGIKNVDCPGFPEDWAGKQCLRAGGSNCSPGGPEPCEVESGVLNEGKPKNVQGSGPPGLESDTCALEVPTTACCPLLVSPHTCTGGPYF